jgi:hypothetical protein
MFVSNSVRVFEVFFVLGTILEELRPENRNEMLVRESMHRVHEIRSPCQWLTHCDNGKCPAFIKINGNFYCSRVKVH